MAKISEINERFIQLKCFKDDGNAMKYSEIKWILCDIDGHNRYLRWSSTLEALFPKKEVRKIYK